MPAGHLPTLNKLQYKNVVIMKKMIISMLLMALPIVMSAQLTVFTNGSNNVSIKTTVENPYAYLMVSPSTFTGFYNYSMGTLSSTFITTSFNIGVYGAAQSSSPIGSGRAIGLYGIAGNSTSGYNYGVLGTLTGSQNGGAIVGSLSSGMGVYVPGIYAGYFDGTTKVNGTFYATNVVNTSDIRLKENVINLIDIEDGSTTLENIQRMNVIEYNFKADKQIPDAEKDTIKAESVRAAEEISKDRHYGLSAQELQSIYPNLVKEGQDGYLGVNYIELVPILIRSIQELKKELDEIKGTRYQSRSTANLPESMSGDGTSYDDSHERQAYTLQGVRVSGKHDQGVYTNSRRKLVVR